VAPIKRHGWQRRAGPNGPDPIVLMTADACLLGCSAPVVDSKFRNVACQTGTSGFIIKNIYFVHLFLLVSQLK
jgi:hypothetical protein